MKTHTTISVAGALTLMLASASVCAGTLSGGMSTLNGANAVVSPPKITTPNQIVQIKHQFGVAYYGPDKNTNFTCYAKLEYSDGGEPPEMVPVKYPMEAVGRMRQYTKPGKYTASLTGVAHNGQVGCLGSASTTFTIEDAMPPPAAKKGASPGTGLVTAQGLQAAQGMLPVNIKAKVTQVVLRGGNVYAPGTVSLYSTISINKPDNNCLLNFSVMTANEGTESLNVEVMNNNLNGGFENKVSSEYNPGTLNFPNQGKYRVVVKARTDTDNHCTGSVSTDFEIKRQKINVGVIAPPPPVLPPSTLTGITVSNQGNGFAVSVQGNGTQSCQYMLRAITLPFNDPILNEVMIYEKDTVKPGKGYAVFPKPQFGYTVNVEVYYNAADNDIVKNCVGAPKLEIKLPGAPSAPGTPKKGKITGLTIAKSTYTVGESIPSMLQIEGDACHFNWRVRKLPFINLSDDIVFDGKTNPLNLNDWNLNNLGDTLKPGNWTVFVQPLPAEMPAGGIVCGIPPAGKGQVFFTVTP